MDTVVPGMNPLPVMVAMPPPSTDATLGVMEAIVGGGPEGPTTVKVTPLEVPPMVVTVTGPVVTHAGTLVTILKGVAE